MRGVRGAGVRGPTPRHPDAGHGPAGDVGTYANSGAERPALGTLEGGTNGS